MICWELLLWFKNIIFLQGCFYYERKIADEICHPHYEFYLFLEGAISLEIDGVLYTPTPGDLLLIPPGVPHHLVMHDLSVPYRRFVFWVSASFAEQLRARSADYVYLMEYAAENQKYLFPLDSVEFNTIQYRTIRLIEEMRSDHFGKETQIFLYVSDLLMQINRTVYEQHHPLTRKAQLSLYEQLCFYIDEHLDEDLSLDSLSRQFFVSKYHIAHVFKDEIGMSIHQYISKKRLARCREALLGDVPVTKVYLLFGFHDYSSFYRAFKKEYGISPKDFKELHTVTSD